MDIQHPRLGWERRSINLRTFSGPQLMLAACYGQLAVHPMAGDDEDGFCITLIERGLRMSSGYRVFCSEAAACELVESVYPLTNDWVSFFDDPRPAWVAAWWNPAHNEAELRGAFMRKRVAPTRIAV